MEIKSRRIFKNNSTSQLELADLFQSIFLGEILQPSKCLWIISPWISNINLIDNQSGKFDTVDAGWGHNKIKLINVIVKSVSSGTAIVVVTRPDNHNQKFIEKLSEEISGLGLSDLVNIQQRKELHNKGILGENFYLNGSMNITYNGFEILDEQISFVIDEVEVAEAKLAFHKQYGGIL